MDDITRLVLGNSLRGAQPVEPLRKMRPVNEDRRRPQEDAAVAGRARAQEAEAEEKPSRLDLERLAEEANRTLERLNTSLRFQVHEGTDRVFIQLVSDQTGELIREFPPRELLDMAAKLKEVSEAITASRRVEDAKASGVLVDQRL
ncbi:MAG: flagellar protein FlaG [Myxococcales bacterium]|nr:MAG: flagellar protein FlaG [Myxococcales bacterium]